MADLYIKHSLNNKKTIKVVVAFRYFVDKNSSGDHVWTIELGTVFKDKNGNSIEPIRINKVSVETLDEVIKNAAAEIASQVDWSPLAEDVYTPKLTNTLPIGIDVSLASSIIIDIEDDLPSSGLDLSELNIILNNGRVDFDITSEVKITGDPYHYNLCWNPKLRIRNTYL